MRIHHQKRVPRGWLVIVSTLENGWRFRCRLSTRLSLLLCSEDPDNTVRFRKTLEEGAFDYVDYCDFRGNKLIAPSRRTKCGRALAAMLNHTAWTTENVVTLGERAPVVGPLPNDPGIEIVEWKGDSDANYCLILHCDDEEAPEYWAVSVTKADWFAMVNGTPLLCTEMKIHQYALLNTPGAAKDAVERFKSSVWWLYLGSEKDEKEAADRALLAHAVGTASANRTYAKLASSESGELS